MRILVLFLAGLVFFFFIGEALNRLFKNPLNSLYGIFLIISGFIIGFLGQFFMPKPLNTLLGVFLLGSGVGLTLHHLMSRRYIISERAELTFVRKHETTIERALEILPGAMTWIALTSPFWLSLTLPFA